MGLGGFRLKNIRLCWNNLWDAGTVTANSAEANFPVSNVQHRWLTKAYRATGDAAEWLKGDTGLASPGIQAVIFRNTNFTSGGTFTIEMHATDGWGAPTYSELMTYNTNIMVHFPVATQDLRWQRFTMADGANPDGYVKVGRAFVGPYWTPTMNFTRQYTVEQVDPSLIDFSEGGQISSIVRTQFNRYAYAFKDMSAADKVSLQAIFASRGLKKDFFVVQDADDMVTHVPYQARFFKNLSWNHVIRDSLFDVVMYVEELL